jgi:DNA-binding IclR family transcriptional regulator
MRHVPQALHVAAVLGIADRIAREAKSSAELAPATRTHAATLRRILKTLVAAGVLAKDGKDR